nr:uncharacterized protein LOC122271209 [Parasteatoda tepidariorum]
MKPKKTYTAEFPCIKKSNKGEKYAYCTICFSDFLISHGGRNDIHRHVTGPNHAKNIENAENNQRLSKFFKPPDNVQDEVMRAELLFTSFLVEHNVLLNAASHVGPLFRKMFPKSEIAKRYGCAKTKTASLVHEMAMDRTSEIIKYLQEQAFTAACDGSHEADYKLYPVVVSYFNVDLQRIESTLLAIPNLEGNSTGENISSLLLNVFAKYDIPFRNCIAFSADNASVMQGKKNGVISFLEKENEHIISIGCCCHLIHLASEKAAATFPVRIDEVLVDIFYHLKRSVNRKDSLKKFQEMYGKEAQKVDDNGQLCPISFASQKLNKVQQNWATIEREAYAVKSAPQSAKLQRWALALQRYNIHITHCPGAQLKNADGLSRLVSYKDEITPRPRRITLWLHNNHYDVIKNLQGFYAWNFYCTKCDKPYNRIEERYYPSSCWTTGEHMVNLAVAQTAERAECVFKGYNACHDFCTWLFDKKHKGYTSIAHNMKA